MAETKPNSPDIRRPGRVWIKDLIIFGGLVVVLSVGIGFAYYKKTKAPTAAETNRIMTQSKLDPDFFKVEEDKEPASPVPDAEEIERQIEKFKQEEAAKKPPAKPAPPKPQELFRFERTAAKDRQSQFNAKRRAAVAVNVKASVGQFEPAGEGETFKNTDEKWKEKRTMASYPVDMSRVITVDKYMPAILQNEVNSELGGKVVAQIEENVFGGHGRNILIPAGSKAIGRYKPLSKVGQERLEIVWLRIITPAGINIHTENAEMTDAMGRSGITGKVDRRYGERYGMSLLVSMVTAATTYSIPVRNANEQVVVESFGTEQSSLAKAILEEHLDIKPRITVPAGSRILISAARDVWFKKAEKNHINVVPLEEKS